MIYLDIRNYVIDSNSNESKRVLWKKRQIFTYKKDPLLDTNVWETSMISIPMLASLIDMEVADIPIHIISLKYSDKMTSFKLNEFKRDMNRATDNNVKFKEWTSIASSDKATRSNDDEDITTIDKITKIMNLSFNSIIVMTMCLCFFALSSNMSANLLEQTKEIGVLRAIGVKKIRIMALYFYEAMVLVLASSVTGVMIGMFVGYTMTLQEGLILGKDLSVFFPLRCALGDATRGSGVLTVRCL